MQNINMLKIKIRMIKKKYYKNDIIIVVYESEITERIIIKDCLR